VEFVEVLQQAKSGASDGLAELWTAYHPMVLRYLSVRFGGDTEDLASQVWIDVARNLQRFEGDQDDFRGWLFTIAHRRAIDDLRRTGRRPATGPIDDASAPTVSFVDGQLTAAQALDAALALVRRLPADQAEAVALRIIADLDVAEVARIMGRTEGSVRVLTHRGLERLGTLLQKPVTEPGRSAMKGVS
jgi:RNA polymerase sigma-70 factor (ECF subfamily)